MSFKTHSLSGISSVALALASVHFAGKGSAGSNKAKDKPAATPPAPAPGPGPAPGTAAAPFAPPVAEVPPAGTAEFTDDDVDIELMSAIHTADTAGMYAPLDNLAPMKHFGLIEVNEGAKDAEGNVAVRVTDAGRKWCAENIDTGDEADAAETAATTFAIDSDVTMPTGRGFASRAGKYPFDALNVGQSFHIPATEAAPQPNAKYGSAVTSANKRYAEAGKPNKFKIRAVGADDPRGKGARVFRVE